MLLRYFSSHRILLAKRGYENYSHRVSPFGNLGVIASFVDSSKLIADLCVLLRALESGHPLYTIL